MSLLFYSSLESLIKQKLRTPFLDINQKKLIVHCCYHKVGTAWFIRVLRAISRHYGLRFQRCIQSELNRDTDIFMEYMSRIDETKLPQYVGSHMIRDPRDIIVSAYFYHLWTEEKWAHIPRHSLNNLTYQEYLNSLDSDVGLLAEMEGTSKEVIDEMSQWNYNNPNFFEFKYEEIINDEEAIFYKIFEFYKFSPKAINNCLKIAEQFSFKNQAKRKKGVVKQKSHLRSGRPEQWKELFKPHHKQRFKELFGDVLIDLGYETNNDW